MPIRIYPFITYCEMPICDICHPTTPPPYLNLSTHPPSPKKEQPPSPRFSILQNGPPPPLFCIKQAPSPPIVPVPKGVFRVERPTDGGGDPTPPAKKWGGGVIA